MYYLILHTKLRQQFPPVVCNFTKVRDIEINIFGQIFLGQLNW